MAAQISHVKNIEEIGSGCPKKMAEQIFHRVLSQEEYCSYRGLEALYNEHLTYDTETAEVVQQVGVSEKRNVVESFSSFVSKAQLCGRYRYLVELIYLCLDRYIKREKYGIKRMFNREEYDTGDEDGSGLRHQVKENGSLLYIKEKIENLFGYIQMNTNIIKDYENDLHSGLFSMPVPVIRTCEDYLWTLREMHRRADAILDLLRRLRNKAVFTRNAIEVYNQYLTDHFTKLKKKGKMEEIETRAITRIEIFGNNGEIFVYKARRARKDAVGAELVFEQLDLQLETIADDEE